MQYHVFQGIRLSPSEQGVLLVILFNHFETQFSYLWLQDNNT